MQLSYDGMVFEVLLLKDWNREAVYSEDKSTFLFWHHVIEVSCILNDDATNAENFPRLVQAPARLVLQKAPVAVRPAAQNKPKKKWAIAPGAAKDGPGAVFNPALFAPNPDNLEDVPGAVEPGADAGAPGVTKNAVVADEAGAVLGRNKPGLIVPKVPVVQNKPANPNAGKPDFKRFVPFPKLNLPARKPPQFRNEHSIPATDVEMRARLMRPRRKLLVWLYTGVNGGIQYILNSPQLNAPVDAMTGPICTIMGCTEITGQMTAVMNLKFETWEGPQIEYGTEVTGTSRLKGGAGPIVGKQGGGVLNVVGNAKNIGRVIKTPAVLSHRWEMSFGWNPASQLRTRRIDGEVIFRSDVLKLRGLSADQLRPYFMSHAIPTGYVRQPNPEGTIKLNTEGNGVQYSIVDEQQMMNFPGGAYWGIVDVQASTNFSYNSSEIGQTAIDLSNLGGRAIEGIQDWIKQKLWDLVPIPGFMKPKPKK